MRLSSQRALRVIKEGAAHFVRSHGFVYSAAIAFNLLLASIPVLFLVFAATSLFIGRNELPFSMLAAILKETFPYGAQVLVPNLRKLFASGSTFGVLGTVLLLASSFSATDAVHTSLAVMMGTPREKRFLRSATFHVALVLVLIVLSAAAIVIPPLWKGLSILTKGMSAGWDAAFHFLLAGIADAALAGILFAAGVLSYRHLSPQRVRLENAMAGSLAFLLFLYAIRAGFTFYVKKFSKLNVIYGSLFSIVCFIIVAYLFSAAYLFCASIIGSLEKDEDSGSP
ncbi:MAG: YihY/virulence factor BrkB family protein [Deltaproteobacteria bacterium]|nr:YihY/virulence factor BrkB family protein [Deltaproteobacteria bacterium]